MAVSLPRPVGFGLWGLMIVALATAVGAVLVGGGLAAGADTAPLFLPMIGFVFGTVGLLLALRLPGNWMGWVFLAGGTLIAVYAAAYAYFYWGVVHDWPLVWVAGWVNLAVYFPAILALIALPLLLFPTGRIPSPGWRWVLRSVLLFGTLSVILGTIQPVFQEALEGRLPSQVAPEYLGVVAGQVSVVVDNPIGVAGLPGGNPILSALFVFLVSVSFLGPPMAMVFRFRRSTGAVRQQIKWLAFSASIAAGGLGAYYLIDEVSPDGSIQEALVTVALLGVLGIPITAGIAITRYRLYDIDRLISRTISYAVIVILLGLVYAAGALWLPRQIIGEQSSIFVAGSTLAVVALFNPIRRSILRQVERRFHRTQHDARLVAQAFRTRLTARADLEEITDEYVDVVALLMKPSTIGTWIKTKEIR